MLPLLLSCALCVFGCLTMLLCLLSAQGPRSCQIHQVSTSMFTTAVNSQAEKSHLLTFVYQNFSVPTGSWSMSFRGLQRTPGRRWVCVCVAACSNKSFLDWSEGSVFPRSIPACSVCAQGRTAGSSSTVQGVWPVMMMESCLPAWWVYRHTHLTSSTSVCMWLFKKPSPPLLVSYRFISWWAPVIRPRSSFCLWLKTSWVPACCWPCVETKPWWRCVHVCFSSFPFLFLVVQAFHVHLLQTLIVLMWKRENVELKQSSSSLFI